MVYIITNLASSAVPRDKRQIPAKLLLLIHRPNSRGNGVVSLCDSKVEVKHRIQASLSYYRVHRPKSPAEKINPVKPMNEDNPYHN